MEEQVEVKPSVEERIAKQFNLSPEEDSQELLETAEPELPEGEPSDSGEQDETPAPFEEVEVDGKVYQVPSELKDALMSKADYTRSKQDLARNREALDVQLQQVKEFNEQQRFEQSLQEEIGQIGSLNYQLQQFKTVDVTGMDAVKLYQLGQRQKMLEDRRQELLQSVQQKRSKFGDEQKQRMSDLLAKANEALQKSIPGWGENLAAEVSEYALAKGYTQYEVSNVTNPRDVETLWKAMQYDKLLRTKDQALKKGQKAPPVVRPGSVKPMPQDVKDKLNFRKAMRKDGLNSADKARLIQQRLAQKLEKR